MGIAGLLALLAGCDAVVFERRAPLFMTPLSIDGSPVGDAIIDTGGGYEIVLSESFGLELTDTVEVLAFDGHERVAVTEPFSYKINEFPGDADFALVGLSVCECNGVGFLFFRRHGLDLGLDYSTMQSEFRPAALSDADGATLPFAEPPSGLAHFDTAFIEVTVQAGNESRTMLALLDTGSNGTMLRRGLVPPDATSPPDRQDIVLTRLEWGTVAVRASLFDTPGLPDLIIGTDVMAVWSDRWRFHFAPQGGAVTSYPHADKSPSPQPALAAR